MNADIVKQKLSPPENFDFPFTPYPIQNEFMRNLYELIEKGNLGIFESPTGTGKSLSIICGALRWLKDHEKRERDQLNKTIEFLQQEKQKVSISNHNWLTSQAQEIDITKKLQIVQIEVTKLDKHDQKMNKLKSRKKEVVKPQWMDKAVKKDDVKMDDLERNEIDDDDMEFLLENHLDFNSDDENDQQEEIYEGTKIYICSRTHSQLAQLVHEVERSVFAEDIRLVTLASRQSYCINSSVKRLNNAALINERCLDLQKKSKPKATSSDSDGRPKKKKRETCKCVFMQTKNVEDLRDVSLLQIQDVEQLVTTGKKLNACPYYAARSAITDAQVVVLPYNLILHKSTREASGISLKNNIIIIDEAHNLLEALADMYSAQVTGHQLTHVYSQLTEYKSRYRSRFTALNLLSINQLLFIVEKLIRVLGGKPGNKFPESIKEADTKLYTHQDFVMTADIDNLNLYKLLKFCTNSKICHKLHGFASKFQPSVTINIKKPETGVKAFLHEISNKNKAVDTPIEKDIPIEDVPRNPMLAVTAFLEALTHPCEDGRIVCVRHSIIRNGVLKFLLLNPSSHFKQIVSEARSVLVAGGTMQPMSEFRDRLFVSAGAPKEKIMEFSCDHIVPPENILPVALLSGPTGESLDFSYGSRNSSNTLNEFGRVLLNICTVIPSGIVCFFSSYDYEKTVYDHLEQTKVLQQLSLKKQIFREPKLSSDAEKVLNQYSKAIKNGSNGKTGALLFSVVGGKLSEGLNFSDELGRCVLVVGLPYPNIKSPELQEKMSYLDRNEGASTGSAYYESLCMKAVNQCIGRAVRHRNDYACVLLLDRRYSRPKTQQALPKWIQRSLVTHEKFGLAFANISKFFTSKR